MQRYPLMNGDIKAFTSLKNARANLHWGAKYPKMVSSDFFFSFGCWFWARKFKFIIWNEFSSPLWRQNFIICLLRLAIVLQRWNFVKCTSNYLNFTKASSTLPQLHTTAWNSKVRFPKAFYFSLLENQYKKYVCKPKNSRHFSAKL